MFSTHDAGSKKVKSTETVNFKVMVSERLIKVKMSWLKLLIKKDLKKLHKFPVKQ